MYSAASLNHSQYFKSAAYLKILVTNLWLWYARSIQLPSFMQELNNMKT